KAEKSHELLASAVPGGIMGGYMEPGFPFYYINDRMLRYLGYESEQQFVEAIGGLIDNCMLPEDRPHVNREVAAQIAASGEYAVEYRMRRRDGSYLWVHDIGQRVKAEDGRDAILSVCCDITPEKEHARFLDGLVDNLNGSLAIYAVDEKNRRTIPLYLSDRMGASQNLSHEEYTRLYGTNGMESIYEDDRERVWAAMADSVRQHTAPSVTFRVIEKEGKTRWVNASFAQYGEKDNLPVILVMFTPVSMQYDLQMRALNQENTGIAMIDADTHEVYYVNDAMFHLLNLEAADYTGHRCPEILFGCGGSCEDCQLAEAVRRTTMDETLLVRGKWLAVHAERQSWNDKTVVSLYARDVTRQHVTSQQLSDLVHNAPGGVCMYRWDGKTLEPVVVSARVARLFGLDSGDEAGKERTVDKRRVHPDDLPELLKNVARNLNRPNEEHSHTYRVWNSRLNSWRWINASAVCVPREDGTQMVYVNYSDVNEAKELEQRLRQEEEMLQTACDFAHIWSWVYEIPQNRIRPSRMLREDFGMPEALENFPDSWLNMGFILPEFAQLHRDKMEEIRRGANSVEFEVRIRHRDGSTHWSRIRFNRLARNPDLAICTAQLIDDEKILQARVELEKQKRMGSDHRMIGYVVTNVTRNAVQEREAIRPGAPMAQVGLTLEQSMEQAMPGIAPQDRERYRTLHERDALLRAYGEGRTALEFEGRALGPNGEQLWSRAALTLLRDPATGDVLLYEYVYDIHSQKMLEEITLNTAKYDYERVASVNLAADQMTAINLGPSGEQYTVDVWNYTEHARAYGEREVPETDRAMFMRGVSLEHVRAELAHSDSCEFSHRVREWDGSIGWRRTRYSYYNREAGLCLMTRADVTQVVREEERKARQLSEALHEARSALEAREALRVERERIYTALFSIVPMVISSNITRNEYVMLNYDTYTTKKAARSGAYDELIRVGVSTVPDDQQQTFEQAFCRENVLRAYGEGRKSVVLEHRQLGDDGVTRWIETRVIFVKSEKDGDLYTITLAQDINARKEQEARLQAALTAAEAATQAKSEFLSRMSHEIRTPMNAIMGMTAIARDNSADFLQVKDCLDKIDMSSRFLLTLINDILEMSRIETGHTELKHVEFSFDSLVESIRTVVEPLALKSGIRYEFLNNAHPDSHYLGDATRVQQVLVNLIGNAIKFTRREGRVRFSVNIVSETDACTRFRFVVADTGIGMSEAFMQKLFTPFTQEDGSNTSQYGGSGLGLAISKSLVEAMGGVIHAESFPGVGSTFSVELPLDRLTCAAQPLEAPVPPDLSVLEGRRVLMAEDHPLNVAVARKLLERKGLKVDVAENGQVAVEKINASQPGFYDAVLMDIRMPVMDGWCATRAIRALDRPDAKSLPIIAMTANALDEDRQRSREAGMNAHLAKPFEPALLYAELARWIAAR
ncbi:MAG: PAS domain-containing protein, partial [Eubacteriales bacterium]|nr:PAS domain-containing protein [Eubacteriales bacterium]